MSDDATGGLDDPNGLDDWLGAAGFVDVELTSAEYVDPDDLDDPWADAVIELPTLTAAQRSFLLGADDLTGSFASEDVAAADIEIIVFPDDPDTIEPFER